MKSNDLRPWIVNEENWTRGYVPAAEDEAARPVTREAFALLLDSAAVSGDSAFVGVCFDIGNETSQGG